MKTCFKCKKEFPLIEFYKHSGMLDGHLNKCKECTKIDSKENKKKNINKYREYERKRANDPKRVAARLAYSKTENYEMSHKKANKKYRLKNPYKYKAHCTVNNAIRDGLMKKQQCEICGNKAHAHHDDYSFPLSVRWLCSFHHRKWHKENGEGLNP